jgi:hypothetical protein
MELCSLGPITRLLKQIEKKTQLDNYEKEKLMAYSLQSTLKALKYLHQSGIGLFTYDFITFSRFLTPPP